MRYLLFILLFILVGCVQSDPVESMALLQKIQKAQDVNTTYIARIQISDSIFHNASNSPNFPITRRIFTELSESYSLLNQWQKMNASAVKLKQLSIQAQDTVRYGLSLDLLGKVHMYTNEND